MKYAFLAILLAGVQLLTDAGETMPKRESMPIELDRNMIVNRDAAANLIWHDPREAPFRLSGFPWPESERLYRRLPTGAAAETLPRAVNSMANQTAGGALSFRTDATGIFLKVKLRTPAGRMYHMPATGEAGFDLYGGAPGNRRYLATFRPAVNSDEYTANAALYNPGREMREYMLFFPLYNGVNHLEVGLPPGAKIAPPSPWSGGRVVIYGGSTVQGACASRPGRACSNILSRALNREVVNLGFSGNGKMEPELAETIAAMPGQTAMLLIEAERNTGHAGLQKKLAPFLDIIRKSHPQLPIVLWSANPAANAYVAGEGERLRNLALMNETAEKRRDPNLIVSDSSGALGEDYYECTVDGLHPTDLGFSRMAESILPLLRKHLGN